ncbi:MAG TPA: phosphate propanoyltransferase [bacterium]|nr:phosphate propanoyltransferase [bacterium]
MNTNLVQAITARVLEEIRGGGSSSGSTTPSRLLVPVGISVRHLHISQEDLETLFGHGAQLHRRNDLYQPGEYAAQESVTVIGPKLRAIERVRILGPTRPKTQVEISRTDAITLGVSPPVRDSGHLVNSESIVIVGPKGAIHLREGLILAGRHFHCPTDLATRHGLKDRQIVRIRIVGEKAMMLENALMRVRDSFKPEVHLDTDDGNAAGLVCGDLVEILP